MATPPDFTVGQVLTAAQMNSIGLWRITTCTVTSSGGTAATASNGIVTIGTANTSLTVNNAFSSDFDNYLIQINGGVCSTNVEISLRMGTAATNYNWGLIYTTYAAATALAIRASGGSSFQYVGRGTTSTITMSCEVRGPNLAKPTYMTSPYVAEDATGHIGGIHTDITQHTGFTVFPQLGNLTGGTITVYGYNR